MDTANRRLQKAAKDENYAELIEAEGRIYELIFGKDNVDDVLDKLAEAVGGYVGDQEMNDFVIYIVEAIKAKNS